MSGNRRLVTKVCERCGKEMVDVDALRRFCIDCLRWKHLHEQKTRSKTKTPRVPKDAAATATEKIPPKAPPKSIAQVCIEARKAKMSYGQYVARMRG